MLFRNNLSVATHQKKKKKIEFGLRKSLLMYISLTKKVKFKSKQVKLKQNNNFLNKVINININLI